MRRIDFFSLFGACCLAAAGFVTMSAAQSAAPAAPAAPSPNQQTRSSQASDFLKVTTRLVSLDVIATDSHGNVVRELKQQDLQIFEEHNNEQKIARFEFIDRPGSTAPENAAGSAAHGAAEPFYSNHMPFDRLSIPPTLLLIDGLNTDVSNQFSARNQMLHMLKTLPSETPIAVFLLGNSLRLLQGFTNDPSLLHAALDKALNPQFVDPYPIDDPNSISNTMLTGLSDDLTSQDVIEEVEDFEKEQYANSLDVRIQTTLDALTTIGQYLAGIPGRKNLIWVSQSFPITLVPDVESGKDSFAGTRSYSDQLQTAANTLSNAQVAVYPVDTRGLEANQSLSASQTLPARSSRNPSPDAVFSTRLNREENTRFQSQETMNALAKDTGGKVCTNTNDLSGCVNTALKDSSSYYELSFYPQNIDWDGRFHKVVVKTSRPGVKLNYRRGYVALDVAAQARKQNPDDQLRDACSRLLPPTAIRLTAQLIAPVEPSGQLNGLNYVLSIAPQDVTLGQTGNSRSVNIELGSCIFGAKGNSYRFVKQDVARAVPDEAVRGWESTGIPNFVAVPPAADTQRVRLVVLDVPTGLSGAVDIPVRPQDLQKALEPAVQPAKATITPFVEIPDRGAAPFTADSLKFSVPSGQAGTLRWSGDTLAYQGDLTISQSAPAFFKYAFGAKYRCQSENLVPIDAAGGDAKLQIMFRDHNDKQLTIDLKGSQPEYSGDLSVDATAKDFFDQVWKLSHCRN